MYVQESRGATPTPNAIYEQALPNMPAAPPAPVPAAPSQYQTIAIGMYYYNNITRQNY